MWASRGRIWPLRNKCPYCLILCLFPDESFSPVWRKSTSLDQMFLVCVCHGLSASRDLEWSVSCWNCCILSVSKNATPWYYDSLAFRLFKSSCVVMHRVAPESDGPVRNWTCPFPHLWWRRKRKEHKITGCNSFLCPFLLHLRFFFWSLFMTESTLNGASNSSLNRITSHEHPITSVSLCRRDPPVDRNGMFISFLQVDSEGGNGRLQMHPHKPRSRWVWGCCSLRQVY